MQVSLAAMGVLLNLISTTVALYVVFPDVMKQGVNGFITIAPILIIPLVVGVFWLFINFVIFPFVMVPILNRITRQVFEKRFPELRDPPK